MAGRSKRPTKPRTAAEALDHTPREPHPIRDLSDRTSANLARVEQNVVAKPILLSKSYAAALAVEASEAEAEDPDAVRRAVLRGLRRAKGRDASLNIGEILAAAMVRRAVDPASRDAVLALREIADRTEGPVVQRVESANVRFVVSVTPSGNVGAPTLGSTPESWEEMARADWDAAQRRLLGTPKDGA